MRIKHRAATGLINSLNSNQLGKQHNETKWSSILPDLYRVSCIIFPGKAATFSSESYKVKNWIHLFLTDVVQKSIPNKSLKRIAGEFSLSLLNVSCMWYLILLSEVPIRAHVPVTWPHISILVCNFCTSSDQQQLIIPLLKSLYYSEILHVGLILKTYFMNDQLIINWKRLFNPSETSCTKYHDPPSNRQTHEELYKRSPIWLLNMW